MNTLTGILIAAGLTGGFCFVLVVCEGIFDLCCKKIPAFHSAVDRFIDSTLD